MLYSINYSGILLFVADAKNFKVINFYTDAEDLQKDLRNSNNWCKCMLFHWILTNGKLSHFQKKHNKLSFNNNLNTILLFFSSQTQVKILVLFLTQNSYLHIISIKNKMLPIFGLMMRNCSSFNDLFTLKCLCSSLVRSHLEYATIICNSNTITSYYCTSY